MRCLLLVLGLTAASLMQSSAKGAIVFQENSRGGTDGELSGDHAATTSLGAFSLGSNRVIGEVTQIGSDGTEGTADIFSFEIPTGHRLTEIVLLDFSSETGSANMFMALDDSSQFPFSAEQIAGVVETRPNLSPLLGGGLVGVTDIGGDILERFATVNIGVGSGFATPLAAGTYSVYLQETALFSRYDLSFNVTAVPEPAVLTTSALMLVAGFWIHRRRSRSRV